MANFGIVVETAETEIPATATREFDVVMLTSAHIPDDTRIFHHEAKTLAAAGMSVCIVARQPQHAYLDGVRFISLPATTTRSQRILLGKAVLKTALSLRGKLYIFHDPELFGVALALALMGKKVVYDCHENLPMQVLKKTWIPALVRWLLVPTVWSVEWVVARLVSGVIIARDKVAGRFPRRRTVLVRNFPTRQALDVLAQGPPIEQRRNIIIYAGALSKARGIGELAAAFKRLDRADAELWLVGVFEDAEFKQQILGSLPANIKFFGWKDHDEVLKLYQQAKIGVVTLHPNPSHRHSLPLKLFEYMGAGLLVIASNFPELTAFVEGCGRQVDPTSVDDIERALEYLLDERTDIATMSKVGRTRVLNELSWEPEGARLVQFCSQVIHAR